MSAARERAISEIFRLVAKIGKPPYGVYVLSVAIALIVGDNCVENPHWGDFGIIRDSARGGRPVLPAKIELVYFADSKWGRRFRRAAFCLMLVLASCARDSGWLPLPAQQSLDLGPDPTGIGPAVKMGDPDANDYIVRDIGLMPGVWRWAFLHPELRFRVPNAESLRFVAEINIPEVTFKVTGRVVVTYSVGGRRLGFVRCDHPGTYTIDQAVQPAWLPPGDYIHVIFEADRHWVSPEDGAQLSFLLLRAGFTE